jgi:hypothetical protein
LERVAQLFARSAASVISLCLIPEFGIPLLFGHLLESAQTIPGGAAPSGYGVARRMTGATVNAHSLNHQETASPRSQH